MPRPFVKRLALAALVACLTLAGASRVLAASETPMAAPSEMSVWKAGVAQRLLRRLSDTKVKENVSLVAHFVVRRDGSISGVSFAGTTNPRAIAAARHAFDRAGRMPPIPAVFPNETIALNLPIHFQ